MTAHSFEMPRPATAVQEISMSGKCVHCGILLIKNRNVNVTAQLAAGVRLLSAQVHNDNGAWHLCHSSCTLLDAGTLSKWLAEIKAWMDQNPRDGKSDSSSYLTTADSLYVVVTILLVNSDNASAADLQAEFAAADIVRYAYTPPSTTAPITTWPTLQNLIDKSTRLITFVSSLDPATNTVAPYLLDEFTFVFENPFEVTSLSDFSCIPDRPTSVKGDASAAVKSGRLPLVNHFKGAQQGFGIIIPDFFNISITNAPSGPVGNLGDAATECQTLYGKAPTYILVDFFDQGSAIQTVDRLNNITPVGRSNVPATPLQAPSGSSRGISQEMSGFLTRWNGCLGLIFIVAISFACL